MTDGTTAIQVSPITEDEMNNVRNILQRAMDGLVGMSQLAADVDMLRTTVTALQADTDRLRQQNLALDEALAHSRSVRDDQARQLHDQTAKIATLQADNDHLSVITRQDGDTISSLREELRVAKNERDDHGFRVLDLEDQLKEATKKLASISALFPSAPTPAPITPSAEIAQPVSYPPVQAITDTPTPPYVDIAPVNTTDRYLPNGEYNPNYLPI